MAASAVNDDGRLYGELISAVNRTDADAIQRLLANKTDAVQLLLRSSVNAWFDGVPAPGEGRFSQKTPLTSHDHDRRIFA